MCCFIKTRAPPPSPSPAQTEKPKQREGQQPFNTTDTQNWPWRFLLLGARSLLPPSVVSGEFYNLVARWGTADSVVLSFRRFRWLFLRNVVFNVCCLAWSGRLSCQRKRESINYCSCCCLTLFSFLISIKTTKAQYGWRTDPCIIQGQEEQVHRRMERPPRDHRTIFYCTPWKGPCNLILRCCIAVWLLHSHTIGVPQQGGSAIQGFGLNMGEILCFLLLQEPVKLVIIVTE